MGRVIDDTDEESTEEEEEVFDYLDELRESGETNMFGATQYIQEEFDMDKATARAYLMKWMKTYSDKHPKDED